MWNLNGTIARALTYYKTKTKGGALMINSRRGNTNKMSYYNICASNKLLKMSYIILFNLLIIGSSLITRSISMGMADIIDDHGGQGGGGRGGGVVQVHQDEMNNNPLEQLMSSQEDMMQVAGYGEEKLSTVLITGSVHCEEACIDHNNLNILHPDQTDRDQLHLHAWPLSGVLVSVNCRVSGRRKSSLAQGITDEFGVFMIDLPSNLHAIPNLDKTCCVRVLGIPKNAQCRPASVRRHKGLKLSSVGNGIRTYTAGRIRFQHLTSKPSQACVEEASNNNKI
ncbi:hypothetical protein ACFX13_037956 [Malus domestica]